MFAAAQPIVVAGRYNRCLVAAGYIPLYMPAGYNRCLVAAGYIPLCMPAGRRWGRGAVIPTPGDMAGSDEQVLRVLPTCVPRDARRAVLSVCRLVVVDYE